MYHQMNDINIGTESNMAQFAFEFFTVIELFPDR